MAEITFERGRELTYPNFYPKLTFTPIFGRNGDFIWVEEVRGAWPERDSEFVFVRSAVHDQRVDRLKEENEKLRELIANVHESIKADKAGIFHGLTLSLMEDDMSELGIEMGE